MEYHIEHHIFPKIPFYNLKNLHNAIRNQMPKPKRGIVDAYKEIIPTIFKHKEDLNYFINVELPNK